MGAQEHVDFAGGERAGLECGPGSEAQTRPLLPSPPPATSPFRARVYAASLSPCCESASDDDEKWPEACQLEQRARGVWGGGPDKGWVPRASPIQVDSRWRPEVSFRRDTSWYPLFPWAASHPGPLPLPQPPPPPPTPALSAPCTVASGIEAW